MENQLAYCKGQGPDKFHFWFSPCREDPCYHCEVTEREHFELKGLPVPSCPPNCSGFHHQGIRGGNLKGLLERNGNKEKDE